MTMHALIMAGGRGTRLWPESTGARPKQYLSLMGNRSLLAETLVRFEGLVDPQHRYIVTTKDQEDLARENSQDLVDQERAFIFEPSGRNTAPCILLALARLMKQGVSDQDVVAVVPSDHVILNQEGFRETIRMAADHARNQGRIVTIGISPYFPHTGYGYILKGSNLTEEIYKVEEFREKPDFDTATTYVASGKYLWNAGMFVAPIGVFLKEFSQHAPQISSFFDELKLAEISQLPAIYQQIPKDSIDYAVMEKSSQVSVIPARFDWSDLGSWDALEGLVEKRGDNTIVKARDLFSENSHGNIIFAPNKFVSLINVDDLVVVSNEKTLLVVPKKDSQKVKYVVEYLKNIEWGQELL